MRAFIAGAAFIGGVAIIALAFLAGIIGAPLSLSVPGIIVGTALGVGGVLTDPRYRRPS